MRTTRRKRSEARLRKIIDTIPALAWCNLSDGSNDFVNRRWSDYTGLSQEEVKRVGCKVAIHPGRPSEMAGPVAVAVSFQSRRRDRSAASSPRRAYRWFLIRVQPLQEESGEILRWYGTNTDIEDRKRTEREATRRRARDSQDYRRHPTDNHGPKSKRRAYLCKPGRSSTTTGLTIDDVISSDFRARIFHSEDLERLHDEREAALLRGLPFEIEQRALWEGRPLSLVSDPIQPAAG